MMFSASLNILASAIDVILQSSLQIEGRHLLPRLLLPRGHRQEGIYLRTGDGVPGL